MNENILLTNFMKEKKLNYLAKETKSMRSKTQLGVKPNTYCKFKNKPKD